MSFEGLLRRLYADFLMPTRLPAYRAMLQHFVECGYQFLPVDVYAHRVATGTLNPAQRFVVLRQDVDTDVRTARSMWEIEQEFGIQASRYFRLRTVDVQFMQEIAANGGEASYHYEEISSFAKSRRIAQPDELRRCFGEVQVIFEHNLRKLREQTGLRMTTIAAHGDFVNRKLAVFNHELMADAEFRQQVDVEFEVYDSILSEPVDARFCDRPYPMEWSPGEPRSALAEEANVIYILVHPRHWRADIACNLRDNFGRVLDAVCYGA